MTPTTTQLAANRLLAKLPRHELRRLQTDLQLVELASAEILNEPGSRIQHAHFPIAGCIALSNTDEAHAGLEVGLIGHEGMFGVSLVLGTGISQLYAIAQGTSTVLRIDTKLLNQTLQQCPVLRRVLMRYIHVLMEQLAQSSVCNRFHLLHARLARLLLMIDDRTHSKTLHVTQEMLARRLGVRRAGVTAAATQMQDRKLISYHRGNLNILDRTGLLDAACSCFAFDNAAYATMLNAASTKTAEHARPPTLSPSSPRTA